LRRFADRIEDQTEFVRWWDENVTGNRHNVNSASENADRGFLTCAAAETATQARAIRRCGQLLKQIPSQQGGDRGNAATGGRSPIAETRAHAATKAGLSEHQRKTALRVASVPLLAEAIGRKIEDQTEFVRWWDENVGVRLHADSKVNADLRSPLSRAEAEAATRIAQQEVSRWRKGRCATS
jgi:hypothetical protein